MDSIMDAGLDTTIAQQRLICGDCLDLLPKLLPQSVDVIVTSPPYNLGIGYRRYKDDTKFHIEAKVALRGTLNKWTDRDQGWSVEGRIPWRDFLRTGGRPEPD